MGYNTRYNGLFYLDRKLEGEALKAYQNMEKENAYLAWQIEDDEYVCFSYLNRVYPCNTVECIQDYIDKLCIPHGYRLNGTIVWSEIEGGSTTMGMMEVVDNVMKIYESEPAIWKDVTASGSRFSAHSKLVAAFVRTANSGASFSG